jgi:hypothetical protein
MSQTLQKSLNLGLTEQIICSYCNESITEEDVHSGKVSTTFGSPMHQECALDKHFDAFEI